MAERQGFEPWKPVTQLTRVPGALLKPLGHLSTRGGTETSRIAREYPLCLNERMLFYSAPLMSRAYDFCDSCNLCFRLRMIAASQDFGIAS